MGSYNHYIPYTIRYNYHTVYVYIYIYTVYVLIDLAGAKIPVTTQ